ncbi:NADH dehydrogenase [ubiquinone] 1 beta subcomplex subunit 9 [Yarrowia sp. B02]|nr:NADH dehydrogenase [ubiquinone] 1 beta subcomplex subunit 9 [Yarrowia sp. B02]
MSTPVPFSEANKKLVSSMYRQSLKLARNWISNRQLFRQKAVEIRHKFDQNAQISNPKLLERALEDTRAHLYEFRHPDPIVPPSYPGGTKYERNVPPRMEKIMQHNLYEP